MSSGCSPWVYRKILYHIPKLFKICPEGNYHLFWHRLCFCRVNEHCGSWHGGIYDFKTKKEYQFCKYCKYPDRTHNTVETRKGAAGAYCRKHGDDGTLESAFIAGVVWYMQNDRD